jgi:hypothetical protein
MSTLTDLQKLFRDLFQLELADLDFGIYRLLCLKREEIEAFLSKQLPRHVEEAFKSLATDKQAALEKKSPIWLFDSATPEVKSLDGIFKRLLEEEER